MRMPSCPLETLPSEISIAIMSIVDSPDDLSSLIRASPIIYHRFASARQSILAGQLVSSLGPAIKDAVICSSSRKLIPVEQPTIAVETVRRYRQGPSDESQWGIGLDMDLVVRMIRLNRAVQYFVAFYGDLRFRHLEGSGVDCTWPMSASERHRIARGLLRYQIIVDLNCWRARPDPAIRDLFYGGPLGLFEPWEMEQISLAHQLLYGLCDGLVDCEKWEPDPDDEPRPADLEDSDDERHWDRLEMTKRYNARGYYYKDFFCSLQALYRKMKAATASDSTLRDRLMRRLCIGVVGGTIFGYLSTSEVPPQSSEPVVPELKPTGYVGDSAAHPPWGWVDAFDGRGARSWGFALLGHWPSSVEYGIYEAVRTKYGLWRWLGFVFWDKNRIEAMKRSGHLADYQTGWLLRMWDFQP